MRDTVYFTICSRNYLAYAHTLYESLKKADPDARFVCFLADDTAGTQELPFTITGCEELGISTYWDMAFRYTVMEFNTAVKPFCIQYLFDREQAQAAVYLDPDLYIVRPLTHVQQALEAGHDIVLTPHALAPLDDGGDPDDIRLMRTGVYNLGFAAIANTADSRRLVDWWADQLRTKCVVDLEGGLFVDQKFMDLAPAYTSNALILRHPGYNVAYWNMPHRDIAAADGWTVNGEPLHFFHFSGVIPGDYSVFSKHQNRYTADNIGELKQLLNEYLDNLAKFGHDHWKTVPYDYNHFVGGQRIVDPVRQVYANLNPMPRKADREEIFTSDFDSYNRVSGDARRPGCKVPLTRVMYAIWKSRQDLRDAFDLNSDQTRLSFLNWFLSSGPRELNLPAELLAPAARVLEQNGVAVQDSESGRPGPVGLRRRLSQAVLSNSHRLRPLYRHLPEDFRQKVVQLLLRQGYSQLAAPAAQIKADAGDGSAMAGLNMFGYFKTETGVGEGARRSYHAMTAAGVDVHPYAFSTNGHFHDEIEEVPYSTGPAPPRQVNLIHVNADETMTMPRLLDKNLYADSYNIGYWAWELEQFPSAWAEAADYVDEVWTPSRFVADGIGAAISRPVYAMPHPVRRKQSVPFDRSRYGIGEDALMVLSAFDTNSFYRRKNPFAAIDAFTRAFPDNANAVLVLKFHGNRDSGMVRKELLARAEQDPRITLIGEVLSSEEMTGLQEACDIFLSLHRAEGFGLNIAECMLLGKLAIATGYSGNMEYMTGENSVPVRYDMIPVGADEYPHSNGQSWAEPDIGHAAEVLKAAYDDPGQFTPLREAAARTMAEQFSEQAIGKRMKQRLEAIMQAL